MRTMSAPAPHASVTPCIFRTITPQTIQYQAPLKAGGMYLMRPAQPLLVQTSELLCVDGLTSGPSSKITLKLDDRVACWLRDMETHAVAYAKEHRMELFNHSLDDAFIEESFKTCLGPPSADTATFKLAEDVAIFSDRKEALGREAVRPGTRVAVLIEFKGVEFGRKSFALRTRITSFRVATRPPYLFLDDADDLASDSDSEDDIYQGPALVHPPPAEPLDAVRAAPHVPAPHVPAPAPPPAVPHQEDDDVNASFEDL